MDSLKAGLDEKNTVEVNRGPRFCCANTELSRRHFQLDLKRSSRHNSPYFAIGKQPVYQTYRKRKRTSICVFLSLIISVETALFLRKHKRETLTMEISIRT